jgi:hypothetical protein
MTLYYVQNILFMLLSTWILVNILTKLNTFIDDIYLFILSLSVIS